MSIPIVIVSGLAGTVVLVATARHSGRRTDAIDPVHGHTFRLLRVSAGDGIAAVPQRQPVRDLRMTIARVVAALAGVVVAIGVFLTSTGFIGWSGGGSYTTWPYLVTVVILAITGWQLKRRLLSPALRTAGRATYMKAELVWLASMQEEFRRDSGRYFVVPPKDYFSHTARIVPRGIFLTRDGWTASISHMDLERTCAIYVGSTPLPPAVFELRPECTPLPFHISEHVRGITIITAGLLILVLGYKLESLKAGAT